MNGNISALTYNNLLAPLGEWIDGAMVRHLIDERIWDVFGMMYEGKWVEGDELKEYLDSLTIAHKFIVCQARGKVLLRYLCFNDGNGVRLTRERRELFLNHT